MNKVFLIGRLVEAPELRQTPDGTSVATFRIGVNRRFKRDVSDFFNIVVWRGTAENCAKYLVKGQQVSVVGELQTRNYEGKDGVKRYVTEIVADDVEFLQKPGGASPQGASYDNSFGTPPPPNQSHSQNKPSGDFFASDLGELMIEDEELPF